MPYELVKKVPWIGRRDIKLMLSKILNKERLQSLE
jgi:hypothetical protein